jgi:hemerythrin-like domain-containing protein
LRRPQKAGTDFQARRFAMAQKKGSSRAKKSSGAKRKTPSRGEEQLFKMLKEDHEKVKELFSQIEEDGDMEMEDREEVFSRIKDELSIHMEGEEKFFYPVLEENGEAREKVLESYEEHHVAKTVLGEFGRMSPDDEHWMAKVKVLKEIVDHHVEEEEKEVFKLAKKMLDKEQTQEIARQIEGARAEL